ncbi:glycerate kinase family protein [Demequina lignilytica]|uniref:Glycerate kinase n=1 Tax=Demequina lignilytica TaxID=3051663 RepID=A0AB35MFC7_9MICO|nr:glycerate kinase [Demequina sp. SYSU T0a273]MDN4482446.1 glycerate kinase [Demequina sp. SYSU T0a273]
MATVVIAPDSFKGTCPSERAAAAIARGWRSVRPDDVVTEIPQADGGEGTLACVRRAVPGAELRAVPGGTVTGPAGSPVPGVWLDLGDGTALCELAVVAGLHLMPALDALAATSRGLGEVIAAAIDAGCERLVVAIGGSASTDGGMPVLEALGSRRPPVGGAVVLTDVTAPLLGPSGAAAVFGPQKGASPAQVEALESRLEAVAARLGSDPTAPGAGAAGGVGYALLHWGATLTPGAAAVARITGLAQAGVAADLVITGEGRFDAQSRTGKVAGHALDAFPRVAVIAGEVAADPGCWSVSLTALAGSAEAAMAAPEHWLERAGALAAGQPWAAVRSPGVAP